MSKMNELSLDAQEAAYEVYIESQREELRAEGAEELRHDILRQIDERLDVALPAPEKLSLLNLRTMVERAVR